LARMMGVRGHPAAGPPGLAVVVIATAGREPMGMTTKAPELTDVVTINRYKTAPHDHGILRGIDPGGLFVSRATG
jgi:hypothetical protein